MPPSDPTHGVGPAPRHGAGGSCSWAHSVAVLRKTPPNIAVTYLRCITRPPRFELLTNLSAATTERLRFYTTRTNST